MANHIGVNYTDFLLDDITSAVQFDKMKSGKYPSEARFRNLVGNPEASLYRKGELSLSLNYAICNHNLMLFCFRTINEFNS